jgi:hypothetical protein
MGRHSEPAPGGRTGRWLRNRRWAGVVVAVGVLAGPMLIWQSSRAAFTATTSNPGNTFGAGSVTITNNTPATAMFNAPTLQPGATGTACMGVKYTGSLTPSAIHLYTSGAQESTDGGATWGAWANGGAADMDSNLSMEILVSSNDLASDPGNNCSPAGVGTFADVAGAAPGTNMQSMIATNTNFVNGLNLNPAWGTVTPNKWRVCQFIYTFSAAAPNSVQGSAVKVNFVWEADS